MTYQEIDSGSSGQFRYEPCGNLVERLFKAAEAADIPLMTAYRMHTESTVQRAKELIEDGFIGKPTHVYGNNTQQIPEMIPDADQWRLDVSGYGTSVMDLGIYPLNTAQFLLKRNDHRGRRLRLKSRRCSWSSTTSPTASSRNSRSCRTDATALRACE